MIDPAFRSRAEAALATVEQEDGVRILLAIESGSRAWGFPSRDSDYDVRFIFVRPLSAYLSIVPPRDVIERPIDAELDLGGWDLRKALGLMVRSNAVVLEWLASPVVYQSEPAAVLALNNLARGAAHPPALAYHYDPPCRATPPWSASWRMFLLNQRHVRLHGTVSRHASQPTPCSGHLSFPVNRAPPRPSAWISAAHPAARCALTPGPWSAMWRARQGGHRSV